MHVGLHNHSQRLNKLFFLWKILSIFFLSGGGRSVCVKCNIGTMSHKTSYGICQRQMSNTMNDDAKSFGMA